MKKFWINLNKWQKIGTFFGAFLVVGIIALTVVFVSTSEPKVKINFDTLVNIPSGDMTNIRKILVGVIRDNTEDFDNTITYYGNARDYDESTENDLSIATFIVDFDEIRESYKVNVKWPNPNDGSPNVIVSCPLFESKYPETSCVTDVNSSTNIISYLPYTGKLSSGIEYEILAKYNTGDLYLEVYVSSCGNAEVMNAALIAAKTLMTSLNFDPDDYLFYVPSTICDTGTSSQYYYLQANHAKTNDTNINANLPYFVPNTYNVYPIVDENNNVVSIKAKLAGCTDYQTDPVQENIESYLKSKSVNYPVEFEYCAN